MIRLFLLFFLVPSLLWANNLKGVEFIETPESAIVRSFEPLRAFMAQVLENLPRQGEANQLVLFQPKSDHSDEDLLGFSGCSERRFFVTFHEESNEKYDESRLVFECGGYSWNFWFRRPPGELSLNFSQFLTMNWTKEKIKKVKSFEIFHGLENLWITRTQANNRDVLDYEKRSAWGTGRVGVSYWKQDGFEYYAAKMGFDENIYSDLVYIAEPVQGSLPIRYFREQQSEIEFSKTIFENIYFVNISQRIRSMISPVLF